MLLIDEAKPTQSIEAVLKGIASDAIYILLDEEVLLLHQEMLSPILQQAHAHLSLPAGEDSKTPQELQRLWLWLSENSASRESLLVVIGGGSLTDLGGFVASTYMRGIRAVFVPTTLLAMVDASLGGKTGIDFAGVKNLIGAFHPPTEVIIAPLFLETLPLDELYSGYAELIKTALLSGDELWQELLQLGDPQGYSTHDWTRLISRTGAFKEQIVAQDPKERTGLRRILNLGHTIGHALEAWSMTKPHRHLPHGNAVLIGLIVETYMSVRLFGGNKRILRQLLSLAQAYYPYCAYTCHDYPQIINLMRRDKKNNHRGLSFVLLKDEGVTEDYQTQDESIITEALDFYRESFGN